MSFQVPPIEVLANESDVEQKLVLPLLTSAPPYGLGLSLSSIHTKLSIRKLTIDKGAGRKQYFPDYLIVIGGLPLAVIEAKGPDQELDEAFREARLYASEMNAVYPTGVNPVSRVVATNGKQLVAGHADRAEPLFAFDLENLSAVSQSMSDLQSMIGIRALEEEAKRISKLLKPSRYWKPRTLLGGVALQNEEIGYNTFGATVSADLAHIFNPIRLADRIKVVEDGYVPSKRRERYVDPIDRVIRAAQPASVTQSVAIENTGEPVEVIDVLRSQRPLEHQVLLIVGSVGVGKSTFVDYLQEVALPDDLIRKTLWVRLNMNNAPISTIEIYDWLRKGIVDGCQTALPDLDFDELDTLKAVFSVEVGKFKKGVGKLYSDPRTYDEKLAERLAALNDNLHEKAVAHTRYCSTG